MKRSDAIRKIVDTWTEHSPGDEFMSEWMANKILERLESAGMKPPIKERCPVLFTDKFVWEREDA